MTGLVDCPAVPRAAESVGPTLGDLIFVSLEEWDDIWRRNQFLCAKLTERNPGMRILFVSPGRNVVREWLRGERRAQPAATGESAPDRPRITLTHAWEVLPNRFRLGRWCNGWLARRHLRRTVVRLGLRDAVLWINPHDAAHLAGRLGERAVVYDVTDDWSKVSQDAARRRRTVREDRRLCGRADAVIVCSEALRRDKKPLNPHVYLVPNGVDARHYAAAPHTRPPGAAAWRGTVLGYTGTLHGDRLDIELIQGLAALVGGGASVVLVGPDHLSAAERARLQLPNVFLTGAVPYARLPEYMHCFDVCIVPHRVSPFTESLNPIKLWEYLALGKPIVSTGVAGFRDYPRFVRLADTAQEFADQAREAGSEPPQVARERRAEAARHSWEARCEAVEQIIAGCSTRQKRSTNP